MMAGRNFVAHSVLVSAFIVIGLFGGVDSFKCTYCNEVKSKLDSSFVKCDPGPGTTMECPRDANYCMTVFNEAQDKVAVKRCIRINPRHKPNPMYCADRSNEQYIMGLINHEIMFNKNANKLSNYACFCPEDDCNRNVLPPKHPSPPSPLITTTTTTEKIGGRESDVKHHITPALCYFCRSYSREYSCDILRELPCKISSEDVAAGAGMRCYTTFNWAKTKIASRGCKKVKKADIQWIDDINCEDATTCYCKTDKCNGNRYLRYLKDRTTKGPVQPSTSTQNPVLSVSSCYWCAFGNTCDILTERPCRITAQELAAGDVMRCYTSFNEYKTKIVTRGCYKVKKADIQWMDAIDCEDDTNCYCKTNKCNDDSYLKYLKPPHPTEGPVQPSTQNPVFSVSSCNWCEYTCDTLRAKPCEITPQEIARGIVARCYTSFNEEKTKILFRGCYTLHQDLIQPYDRDNCEDKTACYCKTDNCNDNSYLKYLNPPHPTEGPFNPTFYPYPELTTRRHWPGDVTYRPDYPEESTYWYTTYNPIPPPQKPGKPTRDSCTLVSVYKPKSGITQTTRRPPTSTRPPRLDHTTYNPFPPSQKPGKPSRDSCTLVSVYKPKSGITQTTRRPPTSTRPPRLDHTTYNPFPPSQKPGKPGKPTRDSCTLVSVYKPKSGITQTTRRPPTSTRTPRPDHTTYNPFPPSQKPGKPGKPTRDSCTLVSVYKPKSGITQTTRRPPTSTRPPRLDHTTYNPFPPSQKPGIPNRDSCTRVSVYKPKPDKTQTTSHPRTPTPDISTSPRPRTPRPDSARPSVPDQVTCSCSCEMRTQTCPMNGGMGTGYGYGPSTWFPWDYNYTRRG